MQIPEIDKKDGKMYLVCGDFAITRESELYMMRDFMLNLSAKDSKDAINRLIATRMIAEKNYVSKHMIDNFRKSLYNRIKNYRPTKAGIPPFHEYCEKKGISFKKLDSNSYNISKPHYLRMYLQDIFGITGKIQVKWEQE